MLKMQFVKFLFKSDPINLLKQTMCNHYANLLNMTDEEYEEKVRFERRLRDFLLSICKRRPEGHARKDES